MIWTNFDQFFCAKHFVIFDYLIAFLKRSGKCFFSIVLEHLYVFFGIYSKFVKFLKDLTNILITLKTLIHEN